MPDDVRLWEVATNEELHEINRSRLDLEERLQEWLARDISVLEPSLMVIGREVETAFGGFIDILCVEESGDLVIVELKRDKTPREITAQVLDYASWVVDLSHERVTAIADEYFEGQSFEDAFREHFEADLPETLNGEHRMLVVGSLIDTSSERIMRYLSDTHGVSINAATFQYFQTNDGKELLARVFLMEPAQVELQKRTKGSSKRRPNLTPEELTARARDAGVEDLFVYAANRFSEDLTRTTTRSSYSFTGRFGNSRKAVVNLIPGDSNSSAGVRFQLYKHRLGRLAGLSQEHIRSLMPQATEDWIYHEGAGQDYEGFEGFLSSRADVDRITEVIPDGGRYDPESVSRE